MAEKVNDDAELREELIANENELKEYLETEYRRAETESMGFQLERLRTRHASIMEIYQRYKEDPSKMNSGMKYLVRTLRENRSDVESKQRKYRCTMASFIYRFLNKTADREEISRTPTPVCATPPPPPSSSGKSKSKKK